MVGERRGLLAKTPCLAQRFLSWPSVQMPLLLYALAFLFQLSLRACFLVFDPVIHDIVVMESIDCCHHIAIGFISLISRFGFGYDHFVQVEYPEWLNMTAAFTSRAIVRFLCRILLSPVQVFIASLFFYAHSWFAP